MPTGYTHEVQTGKMKDFPAFALRCARAMGALIMMRDHPHDAPIQEEVVGPYHKDAITKAQDRAVELHAMTPDQINVAQRTTFDEAYARCEEYDREKALQKDRYEAMLEKVRGWTPPTPDHDGMKKFMEEQLVSSINFDCGDFRLPFGVPVDPNEWWREQVRKAEKDIAYHTDELRKDEERAKGRNKWVADLRASL